MPHRIDKLETISWGALVISLTAIVISILAFNRSGPDIGRTISDDTNLMLNRESTSDYQALFVDRLKNIESQLQNNPDAQSLQQELAQLRAEVQRQEAAADFSARQSLADLDQSLKDVQDNLESDLNMALENIKNAIQIAEQEINSQNPN